MGHLGRAGFYVRILVLMTTAYAGNPDNYPATITNVDGSDIPSSTLFGTLVEELADRTANLDADRDASVNALAWHDARTAMGMVPLTHLNAQPMTVVVKDLIWSGGELITLGAGNGECFRVVGEQVISVAEATAGSGTEDTRWMATNGTRVVALFQDAAGAIYSRYTDDNGNSWSSSQLVAAATVDVHGRGNFWWDPDEGQFGVVIESTYYTNTTGTGAWTATATGLTGVGFVDNKAGLAANGDILVCKAVSSPADFALSTDGGTTWSNYSSSLSGMSDMNDVQALRWDAFRSRWVLLLQDTTGSPDSTHTFTSTDGLTWTARGVIESNGPDDGEDHARLSILGRAMFYPTVTGFFYSYDGGTTWTEHTMDTSTGYMFDAGGRLYWATAAFDLYGSASPVVEPSAPLVAL